MRNTRLTVLFNKYFDKSATQKEREELFALVKEPSNRKDIEEVMEIHWNNFKAVNSPFSELDKSVMLENIIHCTSEEITKSQSPIKVRRLFHRWAAVASIAVAIMAGSYFYYKSKNQPNQAVAYQNDIAPGKNGATLTLANGQKILIKDAIAGNIATQSGVKISKTANGQIIYEITNDNSDEIAYNTLSTTRGEQTQVRLPDGTLVFLNAESSLKYPTSFGKSEKRQVSLTGEGYFEVAKDKAHPFIVESNAQTIEVLGTHFNVNAYSDEPTLQTTLLEGSVRLEAGLSKVMIKPGEQAKLLGNKFTVNQVDLEEVVAWKNGIFQFSDESLESIMRKVSRWYDVEIEYENNDVKELPLTGIITHFSNASRVLRMLELTKKVRFKIEGKKIIVMNNKTK